MKKVFCGCLAFLCLFAFSCKLEENDSDSKFGSVSISLAKPATESAEKKSSRALYIPEITEATVTISGYGMETVEKA